MNTFTKWLKPVFSALFALTMLLSYSALKANEYVEIEGKVTAKSDNSFTVNDHEIGLTDNTVLYLNADITTDWSLLEVGSYVKVKAVWVLNKLVAAIIMIKSEDNHESISVEGEIEEITDATITVDGKTFNFTDGMVIMFKSQVEGTLDDLEVGMRVYIKGYQEGDNYYVKSIIILNTDDHEFISVEGEIEEITDATITVHGKTFSFTDELVIKWEGHNDATLADLEVGMKVMIKGYYKDNILYVTLIVVLQKDEHEYVSVEGEIEEITDATITVQGKTFNFTDELVIKWEGHNDATLADLEIGMKVMIKGYVKDDGLYAILIVVLQKDEHEYVNVEGEIEEITDATITVHGKTFTFGDDLAVKWEGHNDVTLADLEVGMRVMVKGYYKDNVLYATLIVVLEKDEHNDEIVVEGEIEEITDATITVHGKTFNFTDVMVIFDGHSEVGLDALEVGMRVKIVGYVKDGENYVLKILILMNKDDHDKGVDFELEGLISAIDGDQVTVNGVTFTVNDKAVIVMESRGHISLADLEVGWLVNVKGYVENDVKYAKIIKVKEDDTYDVMMRGTISELGDNSLTVNSTVFYVNDDTKFYSSNKEEITFADLEVGMFVEVKSHFDGSINTAVSVQVKEKDIITPDDDDSEINLVISSYVVVGTQVYAVDSETEVYDESNARITLDELSTGMNVLVTENIKNGSLYASKLNKISSVQGVDDNLANLDVTASPNPFSEKVNISFSLINSAFVSINVYNMLGNVVARMYDGQLLSGQQNFVLSENLQAGAYLIRLTIDGNNFTRTIAKIR